jgi:hypothetical protein
MLTTRAMSIGSSEGSPRVNKSIFSPVLASRESTAACSVSKYKVSIQDMVNSSKKNSTDPEAFNIKGYPEGKYPAFDAYLDKPNKNSWISKDKKPRDFLTQYVKDHSKDPGPIYKIELDMTKPHIQYENSPKYRIPRGKVPTMLDSVQKDGKLKPGVGKYNI